MKKLSILLFLLTSVAHSQTIYKSIESTHLKQTRELKIWLPRDYEELTEKSYPIILVLDGDYLFGPVAGNVSYYSYLDEMPEAIVVGVNQAGFHPMDTFRNEQTSFYTTESKSFYDFLKSEVIPYIKETYRTFDFEVIVAHGRSANFMNKFVLEDLDLFEAYINLSAAFDPDIREKVVQKLSTVKNDVWYYLAWGGNDFELIRKDAIYFQEELGSINNENFHFHSDKFKGEDHNTMVGFGIPAALEKIFYPYGPILKKEYEEILQKEGGYCEYLRKKYDYIAELYNLRLKIKLNDIMAVAAAIKKNKKWHEFEELYRIALENYSDTMLPFYFEAVFYERTGKPKKALRSYEKAYPKKEISFLTQDLIWKRINQLKIDFGY